MAAAGEIHIAAKRSIKRRYRLHFIWFGCLCKHNHFETSVSNSPTAHALYTCVHTLARMLHKDLMRRALITGGTAAPRDRLFSRLRCTAPKRSCGHIRGILPPSFREGFV
ncbi:hypothetical protein CDAR_612551 [Caerostris darwini]|uniref:Uncharacterized protein n=1 Tax=Caerostris darwini TaxID=1538125 RepID=A0AAV4SJ45_9ARAC|nr:hypothetical protein CDAR_612551 [Caerostris darwini]